MLTRAAKPVFCNLRLNSFIRASNKRPFTDSDCVFASLLVDILRKYKSPTSWLQTKGHERLTRWEDFAVGFLSFFFAPSPPSTSAEWTRHQLV